jgi:hypothetical protein
MLMGALQVWSTAQVIPEGGTNLYRRLFEAKGPGREADRD